MAVLGMPASDSAFYTDSQRAMQDAFETRPLADRMELGIIAPELDDHQADFIASREFFYLATVNNQGEPTVSYKGGGVGHVTVVDRSTLAFPIYDGNGMFLSAGNMADTGKVGMLFMDFVTPQRVRVQGDATVHAHDALLDSYPGAILICRVAITQAFVNCARYIAKYKKVEDSPYVPDADGNQPLPSWKRIDVLQDVLSPADQTRAAEDGVITQHDYGQALAEGNS